VEEGDRLEGDRHTPPQADLPTHLQDLRIRRDRLPPLRLPGEAGSPDQVHPHPPQGHLAPLDLELLELVDSTSSLRLEEPVGWHPHLPGKAPSPPSSQSWRGFATTERRQSGGPSSPPPQLLTDPSNQGTARNSWGWRQALDLSEARLLDTDPVSPLTVSTTGTRGTGGIAIATIATTMCTTTTTTTMTTMTTGITTTLTIMRRMSASMGVLCTPTVNGDSANVTLAM